MTLLCFPISRGSALDKVLLDKVDDLYRAIVVSSIYKHTTLYILRTSDCHDHPFLTRFDTILREGLSLILNVNFDDTQWLQETLPVRNGGIG